MQIFLDIVHNKLTSKNGFLPFFFLMPFSLFFIVEITQVCRWMISYGSSKGKNTQGQMSKINKFMAIGTHRCHFLHKAEKLGSSILGNM